MSRWGIAACTRSHRPDGSIGCIQTGKDAPGAGLFQNADGRLAVDTRIDECPCNMECTTSEKQVVRQMVTSEQRTDTGRV